MKKIRLRITPPKIYLISCSTVCLTVCCSHLVSLTRLSHSQERVWYFTVQLIVLADSGCSVYMRSHSTQTTSMFAESALHESRGVRTNRCTVKYQMERVWPARQIHTNLQLHVLIMRHSMINLSLLKRASETQNHRTFSYWVPGTGDFSVCNQGLIDPRSGERACNSAYACRDGKMLMVTKNRTKRVDGWQMQLCSLR